MAVSWYTVHLHSVKIIFTKHINIAIASCRYSNLFKSLLSIRDVQGPKSDFTDQEYQKLLPTVARSTASRAIKNNLRITEIMADPNISTNQKKTEVILHRHMEHKAAERVLNPGEAPRGDTKLSVWGKYRVLF